MKQFGCETINLCAYLDEKLNFSSNYNLKLISFQPFCGWSKQRNNLIQSCCQMINSYRTLFFVVENEQKK